ncbi:uncharacterized protein LOC142234623 isoform X2 [Haematobia irritans]|uniref:uncharacterized protein LOC142234623 isoform X2 n=1 Tax=Haematobia irritans TaxID=7368 RepID=UPI003F50AF44
MKKLLTKRMINLHNSSDEYLTANDESFTATPTAIGQTQSLTGGGITTTGSGPPTTLAARKQMPNEPAKPLSAYAYFFRDTVSAIKQQNPSCSFQELSKIVASMWEALDQSHKEVYNKKNELAKNEYIKQMRTYRQQNVNTPLSPDRGSEATTIQQQVIAHSKPAVFTMDINQQQQPPPSASNSIQSQINVANNTVSGNTTNAAITTTTTTTTGIAGEGGKDQVNVVNEIETSQKCTRENCNKRAIINPDWEDEYCSNECVVIHCRNVFNAWVQSNLEAKQQQLTPDMQQQQASTT